MVTWQQQSTKSSAKDVNLGTITDTLSWYEFSPLNGIRVKPKLHRRRRRIYERSHSRCRSQKLIHTYNLFLFGKYCEELSWNHRTTTLHRSETSGNAERAQSGSDDKWWSDSMKCCCYLRDDQDFLAEWKSQNERRFEEFFQDVLCSRGEFGKKIFCLTAEIEELEKLDASETYPRRLNATDVLITPKYGEIYFLRQMIQQNYQEETTNSKNPLWDGKSTVRRENLSGESHGDREEFRPEEKEDDAEDREYCWSVQGYFIYCHHIEPRVQLACREKNHSLFHEIYWTKLLREEIYDAAGGSEKSQNIWGKNKFNYMDIAGKGRNSVPYYNYAQGFVPMKRS